MPRPVVGGGSGRRGALNNRGIISAVTVLTGTKKPPRKRSEQIRHTAAFHTLTATAGHVTPPSLPSFPRFTFRREQCRRLAAGERLVQTGSTGSGSYRPLPEFFSPISGRRREKPKPAHETVPPGPKEHNLSTL